MGCPYNVLDLTAVEFRYGKLVQASIVHPIRPGILRCPNNEGAPKIAPESLRQRIIFDGEVDAGFEGRVERSDAVRSEDQEPLKVLEQAKKN